MTRIEQLSPDITLYLGDCREILPTLPKVDAVVTDPPYGIDYDPQVHRLYNGEQNGRDKIAGDSCEPDLSALFALRCHKVIWGATNFCRQLPHRGRWVCWHKRSHVTTANSMPGSDFELAWMDSTNGFYKYINIVHGGCVNDDSVHGNNEKRLHPTQKPVRLMQFCIHQCNDATVILDPFMGSGTTGVACVRLERKFIGIEIEPNYFDIACRRISNELKQPRLPFVEPKAKPKTAELFQTVSA